MTDSLHGYFTVGVIDLRRALRAVLPHVSTDEAVPALNAVRLDRGPVNLTVQAVDRFTAALALVSVVDWGDDPTDGALGAFDLTVEDVKNVLRLFKPPKGKSDADEDPTALLRIDVDPESVTVTDASGMFPTGQSWRTPRLGHSDEFPDLYRLFGSLIRKPAAAATRLVSHPEFPARFGEAGKAYAGHPLVIEPTGEASSMVVSCGESFLGAWMPMRVDDAFAAVIRQDRAPWLQRLPEVPDGEQDPVEGLQAMGEVPDPADAVAEVDGQEAIEVPEQAAADAHLERDAQDAAALVVAARFASKAMLQRKLRIGYAQAARVLDRLADAGIVDVKPDGRVEVLAATEAEAESALDRTRPGPAAPPAPGDGFPAVVARRLQAQGVEVSVNGRVIVAAADGGGEQPPSNVVQFRGPAPE